MNTKDKPLAKSRKEAKKLKKAAIAGEPDALKRIRAVMHDFDPAKGISLMRVQFVVAKEKGYASWGDMLFAHSKD